MALNNKTFAEFFAGIGLVRQGFEQVGWSCVYANDIDQKKYNAYQLNFSSDDFQLEDIWKVEGNLLPKADLFTASFPCVDLSVAGNREGLSGRESGTFIAFANLLDEVCRLGKAPSLVILENVSGFLTSHEGRDVRFALKRLNDAGYYVDIFLIDAIHFTSQSRPRVFVVGTRKDVEANITVPGRNDLFECMLNLSNQHARPKKILDVITGNKDLSWGFYNIPPMPVAKLTFPMMAEVMDDGDARWWGFEKHAKLWEQMPQAHQLILNNHLNDEEYFYGTVYRRIRKGKTQAEMRSDGVAGCLRTPRGGSSKQIVVRSGRGSIKSRWMTPREYARLQGVSDTFQLPDNATQAYFGLGDAVCVPAIKWIAEKVLGLGR